MIASIKGRSRRSDQATEPATEKVIGLRAGIAVFDRRRDDVLRVAFARAVRGETVELSKWARSRRVPCVEMGERDLDRFAESSHHEGLCVEARPRRWSTPDDIAETLVRDRAVGIALDRVRNPYNVGAILRTAAFFGLRAAIVGAAAPQPALAPTAVRVAEGGAERLMLARTTDLADTLSRLRSRGIRIVGADARANDDLFRFAFERPSLVVVGNEREGLAPRVRSQCDAVVAIRGAGDLDSLNVAVAAGVLVAESVRRV